MITHDRRNFDWIVVPVRWYIDEPLRYIYTTFRNQNVDKRPHKSPR